MRNLCGCKCLCDLEVPPLAIVEGLANGLPKLDCYLSFLICSEFLANRASFLVPDRHIALVLDVKMNFTSLALVM